MGVTANDIKEFIPILILAIVLIIIKYLGFATMKARKIKQGVYNVEISENGNVYIIIKEKKFFMFDSNSYYRLKYIKGNKTNEEELKKFLSEILNKEKYILIPVTSNNIFKREKMAMIFVRDTSEPFSKIPTRFLPKTELKNIAILLIEEGLVEPKSEDFSSFVDMLAAKKLKKETGIDIPKTNKEVSDGKETK